MAVRKKSKGQYHHGDLRSQVLEAAWRAVEKGGVESLSLRAVAQALGVSHAAPGHHFRDRDGLLTALRDEAWRRFAVVLEGAEAGGLKATGRAYLEFAGSHPRVMQLMLGGPGADAERAWSVLKRAVARVRPEAGEPGAVAAWAMVHGLALLPLPQAERDVSRALEVVEAGLRALRW